MFTRIKLNFDELRDHCGSDSSLSFGSSLINKIFLAPSIPINISPYENCVQEGHQSHWAHRPRPLIRKVQLRTLIPKWLEYDWYWLYQIVYTKAVFFHSSHSKLLLCNQEKEHALIWFVTDHFYERRSESDEYPEIERNLKQERVSSRRGHNLMKYFWFMRAHPRLKSAEGTEFIQNLQYKRFKREMT